MMVQVGVSLNHVINVYSREPFGVNHQLLVVNKESGTDSIAVINSQVYNKGLLSLDFDFQTEEGSQYYIIFTSLDGTPKERFKSMMFATAQITPTPYQNIEINNDISE